MTILPPCARGKTSRSSSRNWKGRGSRPGRFRRQAGPSPARHHPGARSARRPHAGRSIRSVYPVDSTYGGIARLTTGQARVQEPGQKPKSSWQAATCLPFEARSGAKHRMQLGSRCCALRSHRPTLRSRVRQRAPSRHTAFSRGLRPYRGQVRFNVTKPVRS